MRRRGPKARIKKDLALGLAFGLALGLALVLTLGLALVLTLGLALGIAFGLAFGIALSPRPRPSSSALAPGLSLISRLLPSSCP